MFMQENQHPLIDIIASWQNKIPKWQYLWNARHCAKGATFCVKSAKTPNQGWRNDKEHLGRDKRKEHHNDITVEAGEGGGKVW